MKPVVHLAQYLARASQEILADIYHPSKVPELSSNSVT